MHENVRCYYGKAVSRCSDARTFPGAEQGIGAWAQEMGIGG